MGKDDDNPPDSQSPTLLGTSFQSPRTRRSADKFSLEPTDSDWSSGFQARRHAGDRLNSWYKTSIQSEARNKIYLVRKLNKSMSLAPHLLIRNMEK